MTHDEFELLSEAEAGDVICSRFRALAEAGYACNGAILLAVHPEIDISAFVRDGRAADIAANDDGLSRRAA